ncbi:hypothetical protein ACJ41O_014609 [Fusarium nematophilum]
MPQNQTEFWSYTHQIPSRLIHNRGAFDDALYHYYGISLYSVAGDRATGMVFVNVNVKDPADLKRVLQVEGVLLEDDAALAES